MQLDHERLHLEIVDNVHLDDKHSIIVRLRPFHGMEMFPHTSHRWRHLMPNNQLNDYILLLWWSEKQSLNDIRTVVTKLAYLWCHIFRRSTKVRRQQFFTIHFTLTHSKIDQSNMSLINNQINKNHNYKLTMLTSWKIIILSNLRSLKYKLLIKLRDQIQHTDKLFHVYA